MRLFNKRMRPNGQTSLFHTRSDLNVLVGFCNKLAEKVDELVTENNRLNEKIKRLESEDTE